MKEHQNLTVALQQTTLRKVKLLAASRNTSVSRLVADLIEELVSNNEMFETARRDALEYLAQGFPMGGRIAASREDWHER